VVSQSRDADVEPSVAIEAADVVARRAGVDVRLLRTVAELRQADRLFALVWGGDIQDAASVNMMKALSHTGNYVAGAWRDGGLVGASVGFVWDPGERGAVHSHITGVKPGVQGHGIGLALKLHQRGWALSRGVAEITWSFDPLIRRNAWFNLMKLGARADSYHRDFYGPRSDGINGDDDSDRCLAVWDLRPDPARRPSLAPDGIATAVSLLIDDGTGGPQITRAGRQPADELAGVLLCQVPADTETLRRQDPPLGRRWRMALRDTMGAAMDAGFFADGITPDGKYVLKRRPS